MFGARCVWFRRSSVGFVGVAAALLVQSCGGPSGGTCPLKDWSGTCKLTSFVKVREAALPMPHSVFEAVYSPEPLAESPNYTPPDVRLEVKAASKYELALQEHMQRNQRIPCQQMIRDGCSYNPVVAQFPEFDPFQAQATAPTGPVGCEKIEAQGLGAQPEIGQGTTESFPERFLFQHNVSDADASMGSVAQAVAQRMSADPNIECIGVTGQSAGGESPALGQLRAAAIKRLLVQAGVPAEKMMTISASVAVATGGNEVPVAKPEDQRVTITVILRNTPAQ